jgi:plastocyanin
MNEQRTHTKNTVRDRRKPILFAVAGVAAAAIVATLTFGGGGSGGSAYNMGGMTMAPAAAANGQPVATDAVAIKNFGFSPASVTVTAGSTVVWTNDDSVQHDITFDGESVKSSVLNRNDTFSHTFVAPGTYRYICSIHPFMHGTVVVTASGSHHANATQQAAPTASGY